MGGWEVCPTTLLMSSKNWLIYIGKGGSNNSALVTTILGNLYWKHCQLIKKMFTWGIANDDDIWKKYNELGKHILSNLLSNTINLK